MLQEIQEALQEIRPAMQADGGDVELVSLERTTVFVRLSGTCLACPSAELTMRYGIERKLKERFPWISEVHRVP
jgi:Fe-S cluster biogenesis protein NfuA